MDVILSISFKMTAEIEIRKHIMKLNMFCVNCVLLRGGVVSALYRICSFITMKCVYVVFYCQYPGLDVNQLLLISININF